MSAGSPLDHRIASAEGRVQAELRRRERAERKLDDTLAELKDLRAASNLLLMSLTAVKTRLERPFRETPEQSPWTRFVQTPWSDLGKAILTTDRHLRRFGSVDTAISVAPELKAHWEDVVSAELARRDS